MGPYKHHISGCLNVERFDVVNEEVVCVLPEVILDELSEVGIQVQQGSILVPFWPVCVQLRGTLVWIEGVDKGEVVGTEGNGAVI